MNTNILAHPYEPRHVAWGESYFLSRKYNGMGCIYLPQTVGQPANVCKHYYRGGDHHIPIASGLWSIDHTNKGIKVIPAPSWYMEGFQNVSVPLQGELWCNDDLQRVGSVCKTWQEDKGWEYISFIFYDIFETCLPYRHVIQILTQTEMAIKAPYIYLFDYEHILSITGEDVNRWISVSKTNKWEGFMLRKASSLYEKKRSYNLLKYKPNYEWEGIVIDYAPAKEGTKYEGQTGALVIKSKWEDTEGMHGGDPKFNGKSFIVSVTGLTENERLFPMTSYPMGTRVKFYFKNISSKGVPQSSTLRSNT